MAPGAEKDAAEKDARFAADATSAGLKNRKWAARERPRITATSRIWGDRLGVVWPFWRGKLITCN